MVTCRRVLMNGWVNLGDISFVGAICLQMMKLIPSVIQSNCVAIHAGVSRNFQRKWRGFLMWPVCIILLD